MLTPIKAVLLALLASSSTIAVPVVGTAPGKPKPTKSLELPTGFSSKLPSIFPTGGHSNSTFTPVKSSFEPSATPPVKPSKSVYDDIAARAPSGGFSHLGYPKPSNGSLYKPSSTGTKPSFTPYKLLV
ncbi:uncharacterized protein K441DRAFT_659240 [Cenococcum geophilum 1.58]|uniref:uncharacterized protein n=1 Tax=Cenococcum geophilum 1.58 TaxID=794803 RepID=UPI00358F72C9|nr:hypothetical protein K441DRAFT_659240 [Cenococcum geophilum 1.58]